MAGERFACTGAKFFLGQVIPKTSHCGRRLDGELQVGRTADRRVLGFMNELVRDAGWGIARDGGLVRCDIAALNHELRRTLHQRDGYTSAMCLVADRYQGRVEAERL